MGKISIQVLLVFLFLLFFRSFLAAQEHSLILSSSGSASTSGIPAIQDEDLLLYTPGLSQGPDMFFSRLNWKTLVGDGSGNGKYDDVPSDIDGIHLGTDGGAQPLIYDFYFSLDTSLTFSSGETVEVLDIGVRRSKFLSEDKAVVIVPNVDLSKSQIVNYSHSR